MSIKNNKVIKTSILLIALSGGVVATSLLVENQLPTHNILSVNPYGSEEKQVRENTLNILEIVDGTTTITSESASASFELIDDESTTGYTLNSISYSVDGGDPTSVDSVDGIVAISLDGLTKNTEHEVILKPTILDVDSIEVDTSKLEENKITFVTLKGDAEKPTIGELVVLNKGFKSADIEIEIIPDKDPDNFEYKATNLKLSLTPDSTVTKDDKSLLFDLNFLEDDTYGAHVSELETNVKYTVEVVDYIDDANIIEFGSPGDFTLTDTYKEPVETNDNTTHSDKEVKFNVDVKDGIADNVMYNMDSNVSAVKVVLENSDGEVFSELKSNETDEDGNVGSTYSYVYDHLIPNTDYSYHYEVMYGNAGELTFATDSVEFKSYYENVDEINEITIDKTTQDITDTTYSAKLISGGKVINITNATFVLAAPDETSHEINLDIVNNEFTLSGLTPNTEYVLSIKDLTYEGNDGAESKLVLDETNDKTYTFNTLDNINYVFSDEPKIEDDGFTFGLTVDNKSWSDIDEITSIEYSITGKRPDNVVSDGDYDNITPLSQNGIIKFDLDGGLTVERTSETQVAQWSVSVNEDKIESITVSNLGKNVTYDVDLKINSSNNEPEVAKYTDLNLTASDTEGKVDSITTWVSGNSLDTMELNYEYSSSWNESNNNVSEIKLQIDGSTKATDTQIFKVSDANGAFEIDTSKLTEGESYTFTVKGYKMETGDTFTSDDLNDKTVDINYVMLPPTFIEVPGDTISEPQIWSLVMFIIVLLLLLATLGSFGYYWVSYRTTGSWTKFSLEIQSQEINQDEIFNNLLQDTEGSTEKERMMAQAILNLKKEIQDQKAFAKSAQLDQANANRSSERASLQKGKLDVMKKAITNIEMMTMIMEQANNTISKDPNSQLSQALKTWLPSVEITFNNLVRDMGLTIVSPQVGSKYDDKIHKIKNYVQNPAMENGTIAKVTKKGYASGTEILVTPEVEVIRNG